MVSRALNKPVCVQTPGSELRVRPRLLCLSHRWAHPGLRRVGAQSRLSPTLGILEEVRVGESGLHVGRGGGWGWGEPSRLVRRGPGVGWKG